MGRKRGEFFIFPFFSCDSSKLEDFFGVAFNEG